MRSRFVGYFKAALRGHPFSPWEVRTRDGTNYFTKARYESLVMERSRYASAINTARRRFRNILEYERQQNASLHEQYASLFELSERIDDERMQAINDIQETGLAFCDMERANISLDRENKCARSELSRAADRITTLEVQASGYREPNGYSAIKNMSPHEKAALPGFLKSVMPRKRNARAKVFGGHHKTPYEFRKQLEALSGVEYASRVHWVKRPPEAVRNKHPQIVLEEGRYVIVLPYFDGNSFGADIKVETSAETALQAEWIKAIAEHMTR